MELISAYKTSVTFNKTSAVADMGDRLATIDMGRKVGRAAVGPVYNKKLHLSFLPFYIRLRW